MAGEWDWVPPFIAQQGRTVTLKKKTGEADAAKPWRGNDTVTTTEVESVLVRYKGERVPNSLEKKPEMVALVALQTSIDPMEYQFLVDTDGDGREWRIGFISKVEPGPEIILYKLFLMR